MSDQRLPRSRHETLFWIAASILAFILFIVLMQNAVGS